MAKINYENRILKTYTTCCSIDQEKGQVANWDCDENGTNTTMSDEAIEVFVCSLFRSAKIAKTKVWLFCTIQNHDRTTIGFEIDEHLSTRMPDELCIHKLRKTVKN